MKKHFIIYDLEYTTWEGAQERSWSGENEFKEIVQIGALKVDQENLEEVEQLYLTLKPRINPELSEYFTKLTGITQDQIENEGIEIEDGLKQFFDFSHGHIACSNGNDQLIIGENIGLLRKSELFPSNITFLNIDYWYYDSYPEDKRICSGELAEYFELDVEGPDGTGVHDALYDCRSLLVTMKHILETGKQANLPF